MSQGNAWGLLSVKCASSEQASQLLSDYKTVAPILDYFNPEIDQENPHKVNFTIDDEITSNFNQDIAELAEWVFEKSSIHLNGYWLVDVGEKYRYELENGEISSALCNWLEEYSVDKIERIRDFAQSLEQRMLPQNQETFESTGDLFLDIYRLAEQSGELEKLKFIEDYHQGKREWDRLEISDDDFTVNFSVQMGGSEGIYIDAYIDGRFDASGEHKSASIGTIKTLQDDLVAMKIMGEACGILTFYATKYLNQGYSRYMKIPKE